MRIFSILAGVIILMTSCVIDQTLIDEPIGPPIDGNGMTEVSFMAEVPSPRVVKTRAVVGTVPENTIDNVYVLVFKTGTDGDLVYKGPGRNLKVSTAAGVENKNRVTFTATLPVGATYDFIVLANAGDLLSGINVSDGNKKKSDVMALVKSLAAGTKWTVDATEGTMAPIPMWGEVKNKQLTTGAAIGFSLTRMLARVNVEYNPTNTTAPKNFKLSSVRVYNYSTKGAVVPDTELLAEVEPTPVDDEAADKGYGKQTGSALVYTDITDDESCENLIYLFEAYHVAKYGAGATSDDWIDNPCLVIGGKWSPDGTNYPANDTYYRVDFVKKDPGEDPTKDEWYDIVRNFSYNVTITDVSGEGYGDPDVALKSAPFNITANVLSWDERNMEKVVFDGVFYLSVNRDEFLLQRHGANALLEDESNAVKIKTDYVTNNDPTDAASGWHVAKIDYTGGTGTGWLALSPNKRPSGWEPDDVDNAFFTFEDNPGPNNRTATVWIKAGRLEYPIFVEQKILSLDILDENDDPIEDMVFDIRRGGLNTAPDPQDFWVNWTPIGEDVSIEMETPRVGFAFEPQHLSPNPDLVQNWSITTHTGSQKYTVTPPAITDQDLSRDALYDRETTYWFEVENNGDVERKGITIHQVYYNLVVDTYGYRLDGGTYTMTARSNAEWVITNIEEWVYNKEPGTYPGLKLLDRRPYDNLWVGTTGGPHRIGESVAFTTYDDMDERTLYGTVFVTFESTDPDAKFPPVTVPLVFSPESVPILTIGSTLENRAFNPGKASTYHAYSVFDMLSNFRNFGTFDQSVVKTSPLEFHPKNWVDKSDAVQNNATDNHNARFGYLKNWINQYRPQIIITSYGCDLNIAEVRLLIEYMRNGGVVILYYGASLTDGASVKLFFDELFQKTFATSGTNRSIDYQTGTGGKVVRIEDINHPIIYGPFQEVPGGNLAGKGFGFHEQKMAVRRDMIQDDAIPFLNSETDIDDPGNGWTYGFIHRTLPLMWVGNGYGFSTYFEEINEWWHDPVKVNRSTLAPIPNTDYGVAANRRGEVPTYNSFIIANALAWALNRTAYQHPSDDYATFPNQ